jgi:hypothetical protein
MMSSSKMRNSRYQDVFVAGACRSVAAIGRRSRWKNKVIRIQILDLHIRPVVCTVMTINLAVYLYVIVGFLSQNLTYVPINFSINIGVELCPFSIN